MPAGITVHPGKAAVEVAAGEEVLDGLIPVGLPGTIKLLEPLGVNLPEVLEVVLYQPVEWAFATLARAEGGLWACHGEVVKAKPSPGVLWREDEER